VRELDVPALTAMFDVCLLTEREVAEGMAMWATYRDPFPQWFMEADVQN